MKFGQEAKITDGKRGKGKNQKQKLMPEHEMFNKPLEEIVNAIIDTLSKHQGERGLRVALNIIMLCIGDRCLSEPPSSVRLVNGGFRTFLSEYPDVPHTDGTLLFLHQTQSRPKESEASPPIKQTNQRQSYSRSAKVRGVAEGSSCSNSPGPVHLEDVITCLRFKRTNDVGLFVVLVY
jgi:hypothetical protein